MTEHEPQTQPDGQTHHYHSPLNSNALVTVVYNRAKVEPAQLEALLRGSSAVNGSAAATSTGYEVLRREPTFQVRFLSKTDAQQLEQRVRELVGDREEDASVSVEFDALTHPGNIYVRGLVPEVDSTDLYKIFEPFGTIVSCKVVADEYGRSKNYGFVNFASGDAADEAISKLNGLLVNGSKLYLNHHIAKRERISRLEIERSNFTNLFVRNIPPQWDEDKLRAFFEEFGEISSSFLPLIESGHQQQQQQQQEEEEEEEEDQDQGGEGEEEEEEGQNEQNEQQEEDVQLEELEELEDGQQEEQQDQKEDGLNQEDNNSKSASHNKGFGFINFKTHEAAVSAKSALDGKLVEEGFTISVTRAQRRDERPPPMHLPPVLTATGVSSSQQQHQGHLQFPIPQHSAQGSLLISPPSISPPAYLPLPGPNHQHSNLYVKNLSPDINDSILHATFAPYGAIISAKIMTTETGLSRGFGFVCFHTTHEASRALVAMNNAILHGRAIHVSFAQKNKKKELHHHSINSQHSAQRPHSMHHHPHHQHHHQLASPPQTYYLPVPPPVQYYTAVPPTPSALQNGGNPHAVQLRMPYYNASNAKKEKYNNNNVFTNNTGAIATDPVKSLEAKIKEVKNVEPPKAKELAKKLLQQFEGENYVEILNSWLRNDDQVLISKINELQV